MKTLITGVGCYAALLTFLSALGLVLFSGGDCTAISMGIGAGFGAIMFWIMFALMVADSGG